MQAEEFYRNIQQKVSEADLEEAAFPAWDRHDVWQRIEQKQSKRKQPFMWWKAAAASIVLLGGMGIYFYTNTEKPVNQASNDTILSTQPNVTQTTKSTQFLTKNNLEISHAVQRSIQKQTSQLNNLTTTDEIAVVTESIRPEEVKNEVAAIEPTGATTEMPKVETTTSEQGFRFIPFQSFAERRAAPPKRERVAILEIPDDEEEYNQNQRREKRGGLLTLFTRKINKKSTEIDEELPSVGGRPNKVWAFVKESLKNETMAVDTTGR
ncbi:hypothetical protein Emtol_2447 [Emticicia oligotrophica DSM 17448]|uniref:Anti-sigma factor n=1 Tax=Emticicia oligotrophica (strain DSM 17448 / CIP 109782 / MTCC 6937 / GPTSA100-15) TaxID=929562 RepID=A0ABM5N2C3_EMTOG|nr:hypothetical protein [Emticicia oligotrophica]AFK03583.1 hypothetical protein Emtol_2447 [Emticicia oligotrophica DSM 17448]